MNQPEAKVMERLSKVWDKVYERFPKFGHGPYVLECGGQKIEISRDEPDGVVHRDRFPCRVGFQVTNAAGRIYTRIERVLSRVAGEWSPYNIMQWVVQRDIEEEWEIVQWSEGDLAAHYRRNINQMLRQEERPEITPTYPPCFHVKWDNGEIRSLILYPTHNSVISWSYKTDERNAKLVLDRLSLRGSEMSHYPLKDAAMKIWHADLQLSLFILSLLPGEISIVKNASGIVGNISVPLSLDVGETLEEILVRSRIKELLKV